MEPPSNPGRFSVLSSFRTEDERDGTLGALAAMLDKGQISPPVTEVYTFEHVPQAIAQRATDGSGQTVVTVSDSHHAR